MAPQPLYNVVSSLVQLTRVETTIQARFVAEKLNGVAHLSFPRRSNRLRRIHRYSPVEDDAEDAEVIICPARADLMRDTALKEARQFSEGSAGRQEGLGCASGCVEEGAQDDAVRARLRTASLFEDRRRRAKSPRPGLSRALST